MSHKRASVADGWTEDEVILLVCLPAAESAFRDDVHATCCVCDQPVVHRPHAPPEAVPVCLACYTARVGDGVHHVAVTRESLRELLLWLAPTTGLH